MSDDNQAAQFEIRRLWGIRYEDEDEPSALVFPTLAQVCHDGTVMILDRMRPRNAVVYVSRTSQEWTTLSASTRFAKSVERDRLVYLDDEGLHVVSAGVDEIRARFPGGPQINCGDMRGDIVAVAEDRAIHLVRIDGTVIGRLPAGEKTFREPVDIELLENGGMLVADHYGTCIVELDALGRRIATFGQYRRPGKRDDSISDARSACRTRDGATIVADWRGSRLVEFDLEGKIIQELASAKQGLFGPTFVREVADGQLLVVESNGRRVTLRSREGVIQWCFGAPRSPARTLTFPRSAQPLDGGALLVCDSYANRVVTLDRDGNERRAVEGIDLTIPRSAERTDGATAIADGLNQRVVVVDDKGHISRDVRSVWTRRGLLAFGDPHHACVLRDGSLLVTDSDLNLVLMIDDEGHATVLSDQEDPLSDPHWALLHDARVFVADSGNSRIVGFDPSGQKSFDLRLLSRGDDNAALSSPRAIAMAGSGDLLVTDTDATRVVRASQSGRVRWVVGPTVNLGAFRAATPQLRAPRCAVVDANGEVIVTDYFNGRVVALAPMSDQR